MKKLRKGTILVETISREQSEQLLRLDNFGTITYLINRYKAKPQEKLNISKGVIFCPDLDGVDKNEILEELKKYNVKEVKKL